MNLNGLDELVEQTLSSWHCPGLSMALVQGDDVIYQRTAGLANLMHDEPVTPDSRFALASITKSLTAVSAALLVDSGKLEWDRPVCEYLPGFLLQDPYSTRNVTLRDMLSHRTGLPRHDYAGWRLNISRAEFLHRLRHLKLATPLRQRFQYNNLMYSLVAHIVETVAEQKWETFVQERIFDALGMQSSNFEPNFAGENRPLAAGYRLERDDGGRFNAHVPMPFGEHTMLSPGPAGALFSTLEDLTHFLRFHVNQGSHKNQMLMARSTIRELHAPQIAIPVHEMAYPLSGLTMLSYGMGWFVRPYPFGAFKLLYHDGNVEGHSAHLAVIPEEKLGVVVLTNAAASVVPTVLAREALDRALGLPNRDWNSRFHSLYDPIYAAAGKSHVASKTQKLSLAPPSHSLKDYEGYYSAEGYPDFGVRLVDGALQACTVGSMPWSRLEHAGYDAFDWYVPAWDEKHKARFTLSENGEVETVNLPISGDNFDIVFKRKPLSIGLETTSALAGSYHGPVGGMRFEAKCVNGKFYWTELGKPTSEAFPRRVTENTIEFSLEGGELIFTKENGQWQQVQLKTSTHIFDAIRMDHSPTP